MIVSLRTNAQWKGLCLKADKGSAAYRFIYGKTGVRDIYNLWNGYQVNVRAFTWLDFRMGIQILTRVYAGRGWEAKFVSTRSCTEDGQTSLERGGFLWSMSNQCFFKQDQIRMLKYINMNIRVQLAWCALCTQSLCVREEAVAQSQ